MSIQRGGLWIQIIVSSFGGYCALPSLDRYWVLGTSQEEEEEACLRAGEVILEASSVSSLI